MNIVIWDLDGTLVDSYPYIVDAIYEMIQEYNTGYTKEQILRGLKERSSKELFEEISKVTGVSFSRLKEMYRVNLEKYESKIKLIDGATKTLSYLKSNKVINHIYTHKGTTTIDVLMNNKIDKYFDEIITSKNNFKRKPHPEALEYILNKYSYNKSHTYYIGDRALDVDCANNAGINSVYFNPDGLKYEKADFNIDDLSQLTKIIMNKK